MPRPKAHGGKRKGAGKPALYGGAMKRINIIIDPESITFYTGVGDGNLSAGIRNYWRENLQEFLCEKAEMKAKGKVIK